MKINKKGQITALTILTLVIMLILYAAFLPIINDTINDSAPYLTGQPMTYALLALIPFFLVIGIVMSIFRSAGGRGPEIYYGP